MNKYEVIGLLGEGSFGRVYKAKQLSDSNFVALKVISKRGRSANELKDLRGECEIQRHLHHPNIIQMLDSFETENEIVVITEFAHKELHTILGKEERLSEERVQPIVWDLVSALYYLHSHRVLHRDLKPQNILMDSKNCAKLCDFGFARNMSTGTHVLTSIKGTPLYMAPELIEEQPYDHNADLWSLGCIIYELLVGAPPFCTASILHLIRLIRHEQIQWPTLISDNCISFLKGLLQKNPSKRLTWQEILDHPFVKGHILISEDNSTAKPLTKALSANTLQIKEQQRKGHASKNSFTKKLSKSAENPDSNQLKDVKNNNVNVATEKMKTLSLEEGAAYSSPQDGATATPTFEIRENNLNFVEEKQPIETEEWIVFLQKTMEEILISNELTSLTQPNLTNIVVAPLRNSNSAPKVLSHVAKLLCIPFVSKNVQNDNLNQIKKVYLEVKLVPNLVYCSKLLMRIKIDSGINFKNISDLSDDDLQSLEDIYMLVAHLVHLQNDFLIQFCDAIAILNVYQLFRNLLIIDKKFQIVLDIVAILTHILRVFPENCELVDRIVQEKPPINFVEYLRHYDSIMRERSCFFLLLVGKNLSTKTLEGIWNESLQETLEALMYDSIKNVRNAADHTVQELKNKEFYSKSLQ